MKNTSCVLCTVGYRCISSERWYISVDICSDVSKHVKSQNLGIEKETVTPRKRMLKRKTSNKRKLPCQHVSRFRYVLVGTPPCVCFHKGAVGCQFSVIFCVWPSTQIWIHRFPTTYETLYTKTWSFLKARSHVNWVVCYNLLVHKETLKPRASGPTACRVIQGEHILSTPSEWYADLCKPILTQPHSTYIHGIWPLPDGRQAT